MYPLLSGLSVIEASSFVASPTAGLYCAQMGAEVIRIDQIGGGPDFRRWPVTDANDSLYWENLNRAKKSVALDLTRPEGRELLQALVRATGQFITNFPVDGFLGHNKLAEGRPDLITVRVMGWADGSPALDYTVNNSVGYPMLTGGGPDPVNHVLPAWDLLTGAYAAFALLAAIQRRSMTGEGGEVRLPLSDVAIGTVANLGGVAEMLYTGSDRPRLGNAGEYIGFVLRIALYRADQVRHQIGAALVLVEHFRPGSRDGLVFLLDGVVATTRQGQQSQCNDHGFQTTHGQSPRP